MERRHDIDWLRVVAIGLLIIYHTAIGFQPWGVFIRFIQNGDSMEWLWYPMSMLNMWRIPILFFVSGMGVHFAMRKRSFTKLILERSKRILLPFLFGVIAIVPLHIFLWQNYYNQDIHYVLEKGHLWFLLNIFSYVIILAPFFFFMKNKLKFNIGENVKKYLKHPWIFVIVTICFLAETYIAKPEIYTFYAISWHGYFMGLLAFFFGYFFIEMGQVFWKNLLYWKWFYLALASLLFFIRIFIYKMDSPLYLMVLESISWIFGIFGIFYQYCQKPSKTLAYLSKAAYPIYIIHMLFLYLTSYLIFPFAMPAIIKYILVIVFTYGGSFALYEFILRRVNIIKPFFGIRTNHDLILNKKLLYFCRKLTFR